MYVLTRIGSKRPSLWSMYRYVYVCVWYMYMCMYVYGICVCICVYVYVCMCLQEQVAEGHLDSPGAHLR
jgi:hypothetical protein